MPPSTQTIIILRTGSDMVKKEKGTRENDQTVVLEPKLIAEKRPYWNKT